MLRQLHDSLYAANVVGLALLKSRVERPDKGVQIPGNVQPAVPLADSSDLQYQIPLLLLVAQDCDDTVARLADDLANFCCVERQPGASLTSVSEHAPEKLSLLTTDTGKHLGRRTLRLKFVFAIEGASGREVAL